MKLKWVRGRYENRIKWNKWMNEKKVQEVPSYILCVCGKVCVFVYTSENIYEI